MNDYWPVIRSAPLFKGISDDDLHELLPCLGARKADYPKTAFIFHMGETTDRFGLILSGGILIIQEDVWGNRNIMGHLVEGDLFAEVFACTPGAVLNVSVTAEMPCSVLFLNVSQIIEKCPDLCSFHDRLIQNLLAELARKNLRLNNRLTHLGQRTTRAKLRSYLSSEAQRQNRSVFDIPFSRQQLADYLSVERSGLSAELSKMQKDGLLSFEKNLFVLKLNRRSSRRKISDTQNGNLTE